MDFGAAQTRFLAILAADGQALTYTDRDDGTPVPFTSVLIPGGEDGEAIVNIPTASVAAADFADKIVDASGNTWRISELEEINSGSRKCQLKKSTYWKPVSVEQYNSVSHVWENHTTGLNALISINTSTEILEPAESRLDSFGVVQVQHLSNLNQNLRVKYGSRYLHVQGITEDDTASRWLKFDVVEVVP